MSFKKVEQVKRDKGFKLPDLIIYIVTAALVAVLFILVFSTRNTDPLSGVRAYIAAEVVFEYDFENAPTYDGERVEIKESGNILTATVKTGENDYNVMEIDKKARTVKVVEANCRGQQCVYMGTVKDNSGFIRCDAHRLRIEPYTRNFDDPTIIF